MDQGVELVQRLQSYIPSPKLLYFVMDDWLLVHRNSFDHFNEDGEPFISQVFLIQIKTGHYIHRCQGQKVDHGTTIDLQVLTAKLTYAFQGTKPCLGYSTREDDGVDDGDPLSSTTTLDFPFRRKTSRNCQFYFDVPIIKSENNEAGDERCSPCQAVWQEVHSSSKNTTDGHLDDCEFALQTDAQSIVVDILRIKPEDDDGNGPPSPYLSSYDSSEAVGEETYSMAKDVFESRIMDGEEDQANLYEEHSLDTMDIKDDLCEDKEVRQGSMEVVANKDNPRSLNASKALDEPPNCIFKIRHRNEIQCQSKQSSCVNSKPFVPELEVSRESVRKTATPRKGKNRCFCCSIMFPNKRELVKHVKDRQKRDRARRKVGCRECGERPVRTFKELIQHYYIQHPEKLEKNQEYLPQTQDLETMKEPKTCSTCDVVSNGGTMNNRHKESYHMVGNFSCNICQEPCLTYYDMMIHNFQAHLKATDSIPINYNGLSTCEDEDGKISYKTSAHVCQICSKSFKGAMVCVDHQRRDHSWGRIRCKPCGEWSSYSKDISAHTLYFHKEKPEVHCPNCDETIDLKDNPASFDLHFPTCSPIPAYRRPLNGPFECHICEKKYALKRSLKVHLKGHQGIFEFQCQYCEFGASKKHTITRHENMHLRKMGLLTEADVDDMRECEVCGKKLKKEAVYHHMRNVHREQKPVFPCKKCAESFGYSAALHKHKIKVHGHVPQSKRSRSDLKTPDSLRLRDERIGKARFH